MRKRRKKKIYEDKGIIYTYKKESFGGDDYAIQAQILFVPKTEII